MRSLLNTTSVSVRLDVSYTSVRMKKKFPCNHVGYITVKTKSYFYTFTKVYKHKCLHKYSKSLDFIKTVLLIVLIFGERKSCGLNKFTMSETTY